MHGTRRLFRVLAPLAIFVAASGSGFAAGYNYKAIAYTDTPAPGGKKFVNDFEASAITEKGEALFIADYDVEESEGLYLATDQGLVTIAEPGRPATDGWTFTAGGPIGMIIGPAGLNAAGDIVFGADIKKGDTLSSGNFLWQRSTQTLTAISLPGGDAPGGGKFDEVPGQAWDSINDQGDILFGHRVPNQNGDAELGLFLRTRDGKTIAIVRPGDKSPDGGVFSLPRGSRGTINVTGQIAFRADVNKNGNTSTGVYLYQDGKITALVTPDTDVPGGGKFQAARDPHINNKGQIAFMGQVNDAMGVYLLENGKIRALASPDMPLPGGGKLVGTETSECSVALSQAGAVAMLLKIDSGGRGVYVFQNDKLDVVAKPGMDLPGIGTLDDIEHCVALSGLGHVAFQANLKGDKIALVLATPTP